MLQADRRLASLDGPDTAEAICPSVPVPHVMFSKSIYCASSRFAVVPRPLDKRTVSCPSKNNGVIFGVKKGVSCEKFCETP